MLRKQLDILQDLFIAHKNKNEDKYQEKLKEYIRYLRWKGYKHKAEEIEKILDLKTEHEQVRISKPEPTLFDNNKKVKKKKNPTKAKKELSKSRITWQVARGAEVNLIKAHKIFSLWESRNGDPYSAKDFMDILGYSNEKVKGFTRILTYMGLLQEKPKQPTPLALLINNYDPYFEDLGTLWFLHYYISSQSNLIIWNRLANSLFHKNNFTLNDTEGLFDDQKKTHSEYSYTMHLKKEFNVCLNAYTKDEFRKLNLVSQANDEEYIRQNASPIPDEVLLAMTLRNRDVFFIDQVALEIDSLFKNNNSPGRLSYMNEYRFREALERLRKKGFITIESFADLDQIKFTEKVTTYLDVLTKYYKNK